MANAEVIKAARLLLLMNFAGYFTLAATGAVLISNAIDAGYVISDADADTAYYIIPAWTVASGFADLFATVAGLFGAAAVLPGLHHVRAWSQGSLPAAAYTGLMAWLLTVLTLGLAIKEVITGASVHDYQVASRAILFVGGKPYMFLAVPRAIVAGFLSAMQLTYLRIIILYTGE